MPMKKTWIRWPMLTKPRRSYFPEQMMDYAKCGIVERWRKTARLNRWAFSVAMLTDLHSWIHVEMADTWLQIARTNPSSCNLNNYFSLALKTLFKLVNILDGICVNSQGTKFNKRPDRSWTPKVGTIASKTFHGDVSWIILLLFVVRNCHWICFSFAVASPKNKIAGDTSLMTYRGHSILRTLIRCRFSPAFSTGQRYIYTGCAAGKVYSEYSIIFCYCKLILILTRLNFSLRCPDWKACSYSDRSFRMCSRRLLASLLYGNNRLSGTERSYHIYLILFT